jgi:hypothetical protein
MFGLSSHANPGLSCACIMSGAQKSGTCGGLPVPMKSAGATPITVKTVAFSASVLPERIEPRQSAAVAIVLFELGDAAERQARGPCGCVRRHAAADILVGEHRQVRVELFIEVGLQSSWRKPASDPGGQHKQPGRHGQRSSSSTRPITPETRSQFAASAASWRRPARVRV